MVTGLVQQLSSFSTEDRGGGGGMMEVSQSRTDVPKPEHGVALNPFANTSSCGVFPEQGFGSGSMMSSSNSIPTALEQLMLPTSTSFSPRVVPSTNNSSVTATPIAATTTSYQNTDSNPSQLQAGPGQVQFLEQDSSLSMQQGSNSSMQQDTQAMPPAMEDSTEHI